MAAQPSSSSRHDIMFPMLKEHLADVIDELVSVNNRHKINSLIEKFDTEATKVHRMMQQAQEDMITVQTGCFNAIRDVLARHDNGDVVANDKNHDEWQHVEAEAVDDNVQPPNNAATDAPLPRDQVDSNKNQDEQHHPVAQQVDDTVQQTTNAATEDPLLDDPRTDNDQGTGWMESLIQSPRPDVSLASSISPSCS
jgi:hypothetical protein